jgi:hypothetical protein
MSLSANHEQRGASPPTSLDAAEPAARVRAKRTAFALMILSALAALGILAGLWWMAKRFL